MNAETTYNASWNYFHPSKYPNKHEKNVLLKAGLVTLKVISYFTIILPIIMGIIHARSSALTGRVYKLAVLDRVKKITEASVNALGGNVANPPPKPVTPTPEEIEAEAKKQDDLNKGCINELILAFSEGKDPEILYRNEEYAAKIASLRKFTPKEGDEETAAKLNEVLAHYDFCRRYDQLKGQKANLNVDHQAINSNGFFNKLIKRYPAKTVAIIAVMVKEDMDEAIQKVLPIKGTFADPEAEAALDELANQHCTLPEFVKARIEKALQQMPFADFVGKLKKYNDQFRRVYDLEKMTPNEEINTIYALAKSLNLRDIGKHLNIATANLISEFVDNVSLCEKFSIYNADKMPLRDFIGFYRLLTYANTLKTAMRVLVRFPDTTDKFQDVKRQAFELYLRGYMDLPEEQRVLANLLPETDKDKEFLLESLNRLGSFERAQSYLKAVMPEIERIREAKAPELFGAMLDGIDSQLQAHVESVPQLKQVCERIQEMKGLVIKPSFLSGLKPSITDNRKMMIEIFSKIPPMILKDIVFPHDESLIWLGNLGRDQEPENNRALDLIKEESLIRSQCSMLLTVDKTVLKEFSEMRYISQYFRELFELDKVLAKKLLLKTFDIYEENDQREMFEIIFADYKETRITPFSDISGEGKDALLYAACDFLVNETFRFRFTVRDETTFKQALELAEGMGKENKNRFFKRLALLQQEISFKERLKIVFKIEKSSRDKVLVKMLENSSFWEDMKGLEQILNAIDKKQDFEGDFLSIIDKLSVQHRHFARLICASIPDETKRKIGEEMIDRK